MKNLFLIFTAIASTYCLTSDEIALFTNSGAQGGTVSITDNGDKTITMVSNGLPSHAVPTAYAGIAQDFTYIIDNAPQPAAEISCLTMGPVAFTFEGVAIFNCVTHIYTDAVGREIFDDCLGHATDFFQYHYHQKPNSSCVDFEKSPRGFVGVALDGYPLYYTADGFDESTLDQCNGRTVNGGYRYEMTSTWPYTLGCYTGTRLDTSGQSCVWLFRNGTLIHD